MKLFDKALVYHKKAYEIRVASKLVKETSASLNNMGICYKDKKDYPLAISTYKKGIQIANASGNTVDYLRLMNNLASVYILQSDYDKAIELLNTTISTSRKTGINQRTDVIIFGNISTAYSGKNQPVVSLNYAERGLKIIHENPDLASFGEDIYRMLVKNSYLLKQNKKGDDYFIEYQKMTNDKFIKNNAIAELRDTIWAMDATDFQFDDLKNRLIGFLEKQKSLNPDLKIEFELDEKLIATTLNSFAGITIYRIIQEFTNNTLKHAKASKLLIIVKQQNESLHIQLKDNGVGFDMQTCNRGHGLYNMEKRCAELNGEISIKSEIGKGTTVDMNIKMDFLN